MSTFVRKIVSTTEAAKPGGPYSQAVILNDMVYVSGCIGMDASTLDVVPGGIEAETVQMMTNIAAILKEAGSDWSKVYKATVYMTNIADWPKTNEIYKRYFDGRFPARSACQVVALPKGAVIEMDVTAVIGDIKDV